MHVNIISILFILFLAGTGNALTEEEYLGRIEKTAGSGDTKKLEEISREYFKQYPRGNLVADARLIIAENEKTPAEAVKQYRTLVDTYRYFKKRDCAQYNLCQLLYLLSDWKSLKDESAKGLKLFKDSGYYNNFRLLLSRAYIQLGDYETARDICAGILKENHKDETRAETLLMMSLINKKMYGFSRGYINFLYEYITNYKDSKKIPAAIFMLGNYYEAVKDYNRAFSAYSDITQNYQKSLEAVYASQRLEILAKYNPVKTEYLPNDDVIKHTDKINIQPETDIDSPENAEGGIIYSISIGPLNSLEGAEKIKKLLLKDFEPVKIVEVTRNNFMLYAGTYSNIDAAITMKIRLAEEFEMNGLVVRMIKNSDKIYIFED